MKRIFLALPLLLVGLSSAERIPVLSSPRALVGTSAARAPSYNAWGDTLVAARYGFLHRMVRSGDQVIALDSIASDSINSEWPLVLPTGDGYHVVVGSRSLLGVNWTPGTQSVTQLVRGVQFGYSRAQGGFTPTTTTPPNAPERRLVLCAQNLTFKFWNLQGPTWRLEDTIVANGQTLCDVDLATNQAVRMVKSTSVPGALVATGTTAGILQAPLTSTPYQPTHILTAYDGAWLGYNTNNGSVYLGGRGHGDSIQLDILQSRMQTFVPPVRKDSLVVFAIDSSLILAKWTLNTFRVLNQVRLDGRVGYGLAIADSTLWVNVDGTVLSFRVGWKEGQVSGVSAQRSGAELRIHQHGNKVEWTWNSTSTAAFSVHTLNGQRLESWTLSPGSTASWNAPKAGLYLLKSPVKAQRIIVK